MQISAANKKLHSRYRVDLAIIHDGFNRICGTAKKKLLSFVTGVTELILVFFGWKGHHFVVFLMTICRRVQHKMPVSRKDTKKEEKKIGKEIFLLCER